MTVLARKAAGDVVGGETARARGLGMAGTEAAAGDDGRYGDHRNGCTRADGMASTDGMSLDWRSRVEAAGGLGRLLELPC